MAGRFGSTGIEQWDKQKGVFTNRSRTRLEYVKDGTSKTLMFGEAYGQKFNMGYRFFPGQRNYGRFDFNFSWMGVGALPIVMAANNPNNTGAAQSRPAPKVARMALKPQSVLPIPGPPAA
jgi:hypothetical protein